MTAHACFLHRQALGVEVLLGPLHGLFGLQAFPFPLAQVVVLALHGGARLVQIFLQFGTGGEGLRQGVFLRGEGGGGRLQFLRHRRQAFADLLQARAGTFEVFAPCLDLGTQALFPDLRPAQVPFQVAQGGAPLLHPALEDLALLAQGLALGTGGFHGLQGVLQFAAGGGQCLAGFDPSFGEGFGLLTQLRVALALLADAQV